MLNFLTEIINNGCSIQCLYDQKNNHNNGLHLITSYNYDLKPFENDNDENNENTKLFSLLISTLICHFSNEISDQYNYDIEKGYGTIIINKKENVKIKLPDNIRDLFISNEKEEDENKIMNSILEKLINFNDNNINIIIDIFNKLRNMNVSTNNISVIRNNMIENIGIGKIFTPINNNQNQNKNEEIIID